MGLDNGIRLRMSKELAARAPVWMLNYLDDMEALPNGETEGEICYWRKCWGYRRLMADITGSRFNDCSDTDGRTKLTLDDCRKFVEDVEQSFNTVDDDDEMEMPFVFDYDDYSACWSAREVIVNYLTMAHRLLEVCHWLGDNASPNDYEIYFYDSY